MCVGCSTDEPGDEAVVAAAPDLADGGTAGAPDTTVPGSFPRPSAVPVGRLSEFTDPAAAPTYVPEARAFVVPLDDDAADAWSAVADERLRPGLDLGLLALHQKCPHLGCRVPFCDSSGWFECHCHGTRFTRTGEHRDGPGPRGLDAFPIVVDGDVVSIDVGTLVPGAPTGTVIVDEQPSGPHCVAGGDR